MQFSIGTKKRVHHWVRVCAFDLNGMATSADLNVIPLGSYNMFWVWISCIFIGMRWIVMENLLSVWIIMDNKESYKVRRRKHQLEW